MKKRFHLFICIALIFVLTGCDKKQEEIIPSSWDCSVKCAEKSAPDKYIITYSDEEVISQKGMLSFRNKNEFDITIHLLSDGEEQTVEISAGGSGILKQLKKNTKYTVGVHADVPENTSIKLLVYDGTDTDAVE